MIEIELSYEAFEEVREKCLAAGLIADEPRQWDEDSKPFIVGGIIFREWKYVPSPEALARAEEFRKTPLGKIMQDQMERAAMRLLNDLTKPCVFLDQLSSPVDSGDKIGSLRIRLPKDYAAS